MSRRWADRLLGVALLVAVLLLGIHAYRFLIAPDLPLSADEAGHALPAARMALALKEGSRSGFIEATRREVVWPFMHPWAMTPFLLSFGISATSARLFTLAAFGAALLLIPTLARALGGGPDPPSEPYREPGVRMVGWLTVAAVIAGPSWDLVCSVMSESLGLLLTLAALVVETRVERRRGLAAAFACGLLVSATFLTKYSYGLPLMIAVPFALAWRARRGEGQGPLGAALAGIGLPIAAWLAWILLPNAARSGELVAAFVNRDEGLQGLADSSFYARAIAGAVGTPVALATLVLWGLLPARALGRRLCAVAFVVLTLVMLTLHPNKQVRYLFTALPVILVVAETELARRLRRLRGSEGLWLAGALVLVVTRNPVREIRQAAAEAARLDEARSILTYVETNVSGRQPVLFLGTTGLLPHFALTWKMLEREQREPEVDLLHFPRPGTFRAGYPAEEGPEYAAVLAQALASGRFRSVVTLELGPASPFLPDWLAKWDAFGQNYVRAMAEAETPLGYTCVSERAFPAGGATVRIYVPRDSDPQGSDLARAGDRSD